MLRWLNASVEYGRCCPISLGVVAVTFSIRHRQQCVCVRLFDRSVVLFLLAFGCDVNFEDDELCSID